jgi:serine protease Do
MQDPHRHPARKIIAARRLTLLGSVAVLGATLAFGGPLAVNHAITPALAAMPSQTQNGPAGFADLVTRVKPAVISVRVKLDQSADAGPQEQNQAQGDAEQSMPEQFRNTPFEKFFRQFGDNGPMGQHGPRNAMPRHQVITGVGSGFFISADGYAVTNNHVVDHATSVEVKTDDGKTFTAKVVGTDPKTDLALIKVDGKTDFTFVNFEDQQARVGDWVVAVGNPYGLGGTVTAGIVSASGRDIGSGPYDDYLQIDAPINKGNSGGPTFDMNGNVIGVNTAIYSPSGGSIGIGFDVPAQTAKLVIAQLKDKGAVTRGYIGVQVQPVTQEIADSLGLKTASGALVAEPQSDGPAAKAGVEAGDVITAVNGTAVKDSRDLARQISTMAPGASAKLDVLHRGEQKVVSVTLQTMPNQQQASAAEDDGGSATAASPHLGITVAPASGVAGTGGKGVVTTGIDPDGPAAERGLKSGDVILDVAGSSVGTAGDLRKALSDAKSKGKHDVLMRVKSADNTHFVAMPIG